MAPTGLGNAREFCLLLMRLVLAAVFAAAALPKIQASGEFAAAVLNYRVTGPVWSAWIALFLPWLELAAAFGLLTPPLRRASGLVLAGLLLLFMAMHAQAWARGLEIACGCFGASPEETGEPTNYAWLLARNALLAAACWFILQKDFYGTRGRSQLPHAQ